MLRNVTIQFDFSQLMFTQLFVDTETKNSYKDALNRKFLQIQQAQKIRTLKHPDYIVNHNNQLILNAIYGTMPSIHLR